MRGADKREQLDESYSKMSASKRARIEHQQQGGVLTKLFESPLCLIRRMWSNISQPNELEEQLEHSPDCENAKTKQF